jgi:hypothetical protein
MTTLTCRPLPPLEYLNELFEIDETSPSGLRRIKTVSSRAQKGCVAGTLLRQYWRVNITYDKKQYIYYAHRLVYAMGTGRNIENVFIDHIDGIEKRNTLSNLREALPAENMRNRVKSKGKKTSDYLGVYWYSKRKKWVAQIKHNNKKTYIGQYDSQEAAARAYNEIALAYHGAFANLNVIPI